MEIALISLGSSGVAVAWSHVYRLAIRRWRWVVLAPAQLVPRVIAASLLLGTLIAASATPIWWAALGQIGRLAAWVPGALLTWSSMVAVWSAIYFGVHYRVRMRQLELSQLQLDVVAKDAQLHGLMSQLQPHFLFNCLNSVRALIVEDPAKAQATVTALSDLLRYSLHSAKEPTVPLAAELAMVQIYLGLEAVRFEDRLHAKLDVADDTAALRVPAMLIQSLVENGVKHGIERTPAGGTIHVAIWRAPDVLRIRVTNPGRLGASPPSTQIGLANARARLRLLYGATAALSLTDDGRTVTAEVALPLALPPETASAPAASRAPTAEPAP